MFKVLPLFFSLQILFASDPSTQDASAQGVMIRMFTVVNGQVLYQNGQPLKILLAPRTLDTSAPLPATTLKKVLEIMKGITERRLGCSLTSPKLMFGDHEYLPTDVLTSGVNALQFRFCCELALPEIAGYSWLPS